MGASVDACHDDTICWFEEQAQYWVDLITAENNPCYRPMILALLKSGKTLNSVMSDLHLEDHAKKFHGILAEKARAAGDGIKAVVYYFHVMKDPFEANNPVKRSTLHMHLFVPGNGTMAASSCWETTLYEGKNGNGDMMFLEPEETPDNVNVPERMKVLWESPFA
jgi:hypothetical protein